MEHIIHKTLIQLGISPSLSGYHNIVNCLKELENSVDAKIIAVYKIVARKYNSDWRRIERNIRKAIEVSLSRGDLELLHEIFSYVVTPEGRLTNSEFLKCLAIYVKEVQQNG